MLKKIRKVTKKILLLVVELGQISFVETRIELGYYALSARACSENIQQGL